MKRETKWIFILALLFATSIFAQSGGQTAWIPIQTPPELGYGQTFSQDLGVTPQNLQRIAPGTYTDGVYTLHFSEQNHFPSYPGEWEVGIAFGTQRLCDFYGWGTATFAPAILSCTSSAYIVVDQALPSGPAQGANDLVVTWTVNVEGSINGGWPIKFKDAWLTFTPTN